jgi:hypothetical protein
LSPFARIALFAVVLLASFGAGAALGTALPDLGPDDPPAAPMESHP